MAYAIIHPNQNILEKSLLGLVNKHLETAFLSLEQVAQDPDFCIVQKEEQGNIKIEQIKKLQKKLIYSPLNRKYQFGIIKDAYLMTTEAQNALLKTLEECHENTILIITVNNENAVLKTILSRCNRIYPKEQQIEEQCSDFSQIEQFLKRPLYEQINEVENVVKEKTVDNFLKNLTDFFRNEHKRKLKAGEDTLDQEEILRTIQQAKQRISRNVNTKIALEFVCFQIDKYFGTNYK